MQKMYYKYDKTVLIGSHLFKSPIKARAPHKKKRPHAFVKLHGPLISL